MGFHLNPQSSPLQTQKPPLLAPHPRINQSKKEEKKKEKLLHELLIIEKETNPGKDGFPI
jgi:hypothetical protein